jgi:DNA modification methylase
MTAAEVISGAAPFLRSLPDACVDAVIASPGGLILDPFSGSATTGVGALLEGRRFLGSEQVEAIHAVGLERLQAAGTGVSLAAFRAGQVRLFAPVP